MHLFDSDTLSHLWARHERVIERLRRCEDTEIGTTSITKSEMNPGTPRTSARLASGELFDRQAKVG